MQRFSTRTQGAVALTLCFVAGFVDAVAYLKSDLFVANMTGNTVLIGIGLARHDWTTSAFRVATVGLFFIGAVAGRMLVSVTAERRWVPLLIEAVLVVAAMAVPSQHWLWAWLLATAMGIQSTAVTQFGGVAVNTVVVTGAIARVAEYVADLLPGARGKVTERERLQGRMQAGAWAVYGVGALVATWASPFPENLVVPAACLTALAIFLAKPARPRGG